jgi:hypothetical protein
LFLAFFVVAGFRRFPGAECIGGAVGVVLAGLDQPVLLRRTFSECVDSLDYFLQTVR